MPRDPSSDEIARWKARLENQEFQRHLLQFQDWMYQLLEGYRRMTGTRLIRVVFPRHNVKSLESVIDKIRRRRREDSSYDLHMIDDLVGVKVLCPYESSAREVIQWIWAQKDKVNVTPRRFAKALVRRPGGYRGWHLTASPIRGRHPHWIGSRCEIQVKTMLQEAWDAQTHEITYKKEPEIAAPLLKAMRNQSRELSKLDRKAESLRKEIKRVEEYEERMKDAAAAVYFYKAAPMLREMARRFGFKVNRKRLLNCSMLPAPVVSTLNRAIEEFLAEGRLDQEGHLCDIAALLAICQRDPTQEAMAVWLADELVTRMPDHPDAEDIRAGILWGLDRLGEAVASGRRVLEKIEKMGGQYQESRKAQKEANWCYWVAELARAGKKIEGSLRGEILDRSDQLIADHSGEPGFLDTAGFAKISLGQSADEVRAGLRLVRKAYRLALASGKPLDRKLALPFRQRHEGVAKRRLKEIEE